MLTEEELAGLTKDNITADDLVGMLSLHNRDRHVLPPDSRAQVSVGLKIQMASLWAISFRDLVLVLQQLKMFSVLRSTEQSL